MLSIMIGRLGVSEGVESLSCIPIDNDSNEIASRRCLRTTSVFLKFCESSIPW
jgi:hypothetical protein